LIAGPDPRDPNSQQQPAVSLDDWNASDLAGLTIGVYQPWFRHAAPAVVAANEAMLAQFAGKTPVELMQDPRAITVGRNLFANNCAACHGSDGRGAPGFPNITDADWLWGGEPETIEATIREGRNGIMTPWIDVIGPKGVDDVVAYVMSLSGRQANGGDAAAGKTQFEAICAACHGVDGKGNHALGAPNLTDNVWLHGGSQATIRETVTKGRNGVMPAHGDRMGEARVKLLTAYVLSMGEQRVAQAGP
jgi:cytochrome c oxidase cbb3-type subunit 3